MGHNEEIRALERKVEHIERVLFLMGVDLKNEFMNGDLKDMQKTLQLLLDHLGLELKYQKPVPEKTYLGPKEKKDAE